MRQTEQTPTREEIDVLQLARAVRLALEQAGPSEMEKTLLDRERASYDVDHSEGAPWREVEVHVRRMLNA